MDYFNYPNFINPYTSQQNHTPSSHQNHTPSPPHITAWRLHLHYLEMAENARARNPNRVGTIQRGEVIASSQGAGNLQLASDATSVGITIFEPRVWGVIVGKIAQEFKNDACPPVVTAMTRKVGTQYIPVVSIKFIPEKKATDLSGIGLKLKALLEGDTELKQHGYNSSVQIHFETDNKKTGVRSFTEAYSAMPTEATSSTSRVKIAEATSSTSRTKTPTIVRSPNDEGYGSHHTDKKSVKHLTCYYYKNGGCKKSAQECLYAHYDTGKYAERPVPVVPGGRPVAGRNAENECMAYQTYLQDKLDATQVETDAMQQAALVNAAAYASHTSPYVQGYNMTPAGSTIYTPTAPCTPIGVEFGSPPHMGPLIPANDAVAMAQSSQIASARVPGTRHRLTVGAERAPDVFGPFASPGHAHNSSVAYIGPTVPMHQPMAVHADNARPVMAARELCLGLDAGRDTLNKVGNMLAGVPSRARVLVGPALAKVEEGKAENASQRTRAEVMMEGDPAFPYVFGSNLSIHDH